MLIVKTFKYLVLVAVMFLFIGCGYHQHHHPVKKSPVKVVKIYDVNQSNINSTINSLADQLFANKKIHTDKSVIITSFVQLNEFNTTSEFGRILSESLINDLSNRDFNIIEFRGQLAVSLNKDGEYFLSRKIQKLKEKVPNTYVVVGTYSRQVGKVMINARLIDNITGKIISSARSTYVHNLKNDCTLFKDCKPIRTIKLVEEK